MRLTPCLTLLLSLATVGQLHAGEADVVAVEVSRSAPGTYRFDVTVRHADSGWDHYADRWEVVAPDGSVLATRTLAHPHDQEQPFTRSLGGVKIPAAIDRATLRAHDSVHAYGGATIRVDLPRDESTPHPASSPTHLAEPPPASKGGGSGSRHLCT